MKKNVKRAIAFLMSAALLCPCMPAGGTVQAASGQDIIRWVKSDKAAYNPGSKVKLSIRLKNPSKLLKKSGTLVLKFSHLEKSVGKTVKKTVTLKRGKAKTIKVNWQPPKKDFQGYFVEVEFRNKKGKVLDSDSIGVDVSSSWLKFPRYGYLTQYGKDADVDGAIEAMKDYHINGIQFYDWQYKHHEPIKLEEDGTMAETWKNLAGHEVSSATLEKYISAAHKHNMKTMQYNLIYGAVDGYQEDGVDPAWGLYDDQECKTQWRMNMPDGWQTSALWFFDPDNQEWRDYFFKKETELYKYLDFDGFHADTVGDFGIKYNTKGEAVSITDTFKDYLNTLKGRLGDKYLIMNAVGAKGHEQVHTSKVDAIYTEIWDWDGHPDYNSLKEIVDVSREESGGKSLIVPAYMNYDYSSQVGGEDNGYFNDPAVKLTDIAVVAAGGTRLELGDTNRMLSQEYFPNRNLMMSPGLKKWENTMYDFIVAYENLLRDGQKNTNNQYVIRNYPSSTDGSPGTVWTYSKKDEDYDTIQMINLLELSDTGWRDTYAAKEAPKKAKNISVKYYYNGEVESLWLASPDRNNGISQKLSYRKGEDADGKYIDFVVPSLDYWNMIYMKKKAGSDTDDSTVGAYGGNGTLVNGGFEDGYLKGWTTTGDHTGVDSADTKDSGYKCYFYSAAGYTQKIEQTVSGLSNGVYEVTADVKQNTGRTLLCRMELTTGGDVTYQNVSHSEQYETITKEVKVTDGTLNIAFYLAADQEANLQIDNVQLRRIR